MPRLGNPLVYDLIEIAATLTDVAGRQNLRKAALRRGVSAAYYAVFHALCFVCASELVGWGRGEDLEPIYRSVEHGGARRRLTGKEAARVGREVLAIGANLAILQDRRHLADYAPPALPVSRNWASESLTLATETIAAIERLDDVQRRRLAILLIARPRVA